MRRRPSGPGSGAPWEPGRGYGSPPRGRGGIHLLDATMLYAPQSGGVSRYLREKRSWLAHNTGMRHTLVAPAPHDGVGPFGEILVRTPALVPSPYRWPLDAPRWVREICARAPDIIEAGDAGSLGWIALYAARRLGVPLVAFCHSDVVKLVAQRMSRPVAAVVREYVRAFYRRCDVVVAPSQYMKSQLAAWGVDRVVVRPLGVDLDVFSPAARRYDLRRQLALPRDCRVMVYAGRFVPEKNIDVLVDAFRRLGRGYRLVMAGGGGNVPRDPQVLHVPYVDSPRDLARLLASADGLVHAGDQETFGLILLEAMACGRGVVAPFAGAAPEVVGDAGILVRPRDGAALAEGIRAFYDAGTEAIGLRARSRVEERYTWDAAMRGMLGVYRAALTAAPSAVARYAPS